MAPTHPSRSLAALAAPVGLAVTLLTACSAAPSGASGGTSGGASSAAGTPSDATNGASTVTASPSAAVAAAPGLQDASADEILAKARAALLSASSVHTKGVVRNGDSAYTLDLRLVRGVGATGSVAGAGTTLGVLRIGKVAYVRLDQASWRAATGSDAAARGFAGKYLKVTDADGSSFKPFLTLTDVQQTYGQALSPGGTVTKGAVTRMRGQRVLDLRIDGGAAGDVFVALDGRPYPLRLAYGRAAAQHVDFDQFGAKVALTAPPASKVVAVPGA